MDDIEAALDMHFAFRRRPTPAAAAIRPQFRVPLLLLILQKCRASKLHWKGLQVLNWAVQSDARMNALVAIAGGRQVLHMPIVRIEPMLDRAIDLVVGLGYARFDGGRTVSLTALGKEMALEVASAPVMQEEKRRLSSLPGKVSQSTVNLLLEWRNA
ncbi:hypothetical protein [Plantactinospora sp. CA-290183]|uniref:hypothetical protein n=1 Tax=Plantactinospora sp. CA-290183 TaxID=3240006 RepID=UPI003D919C21